MQQGPEKWGAISKTILYLSHFSEDRNTALRVKHRKQHWISNENRRNNICCSHPMHNGNVPPYSTSPPPMPSRSLQRVQAVSAVTVYSTFHKRYGPVDRWVWCGHRTLPVGNWRLWRLLTGRPATSVLIARSKLKAKPLTHGLAGDPRFDPGIDSPTMGQLWIPLAAREISNLNANAWPPSGLRPR